MLYPNYIKKNYHKEINYKNRGMDLEYLITQANQYYEEQKKAFIYKKPTPIKVVKMSFKNNAKRITDAFYESPSTLDFNGIYQGQYIEFDAKVTQNKTSFPIANVHEHQIRHMKNIYNEKGIVFLIIYMNEEYFLFPAYAFLEFLKNETRKSIPYEYIKKNSFKINLTLHGLDYLLAVDKLLEEKHEKN